MKSVTEQEALELLNRVPADFSWYDVFPVNEDWEQDTDYIVRISNSLYLCSELEMLEFQRSIEE